MQYGGVPVTKMSRYKDKSRCWRPTASWNRSSIVTCTCRTNPLRPCQGSLRFFNWFIFADAYQRHL